jgi:hypothetical protein
MRAFNEVDNFAMFNGEHPQELFRRLSSLHVKMNNLGANHCYGKKMKRKFVQAIFPFMNETMNAIKRGVGYHEMTTNDVFNEIISMWIFEKNAKDSLARAHSLRASNLALKPK